MTNHRSGVLEHLNYLVIYLQFSKDKNMVGKSKCAEKPAKHTFQTIKMILFVT